MDKYMSKEELNMFLNLININKKDTLKLRNLLFNFHNFGLSIKNISDTEKRNFLLLSSEKRREIIEELQRLTEINKVTTGEKDMIFQMINRLHGMIACKIHEVNYLNSYYIKENENEE